MFKEIGSKDMYLVTNKEKKCHLEADKYVVMVLESKSSMSLCKSKKDINNLGQIKEGDIVHLAFTEKEIARAVARSNKNKEDRLSVRKSLFGIFKI